MMFFIYAAIVLAVVLFLLKYFNGNGRYDSYGEYALLVDVRTPEEHASMKVPNSINVPLHKIRHHIDLFRLHKKEIVIFCRSGNRSAQAIQILREYKIHNVINGGSYKQVLSATKL